MIERQPPGLRGVWREDDDARAVYSEAAGIGRMMPSAVAVPADVRDVVALVRWANACGTPLIARGSGSSMAGGAIGDGVIVDLSRMRALGAVDRVTRSVRAEPGVICADVCRSAHSAGLRFPVSPSSAPFCTIGGMTATNAAGPHTLRYGSMRQWVRAIDCVFDDGTTATIRRGEEPPASIPAVERFLAARGEHPVLARPVRKNSSGYHPGPDLVDVLAGSEGTLAIFTRMELMLTARAVVTSSILAAFPSLEAASIAATIAREQGAVACELLDWTFIEIAREGGSRSAASIPLGMEAALLVELESPDSNAAHRETTSLASQLAGAGAALTSVALSPEDEHVLWALRHAASPILARLDPALKSMQFIEDGVVPPEHLAAYVRGVRAALDRAGLRGVIFGHAGDAHIHVNPLIDVRLPDWRVRMEALFEDVCALTVALGGSMSGEHGDGRVRAPVLGAVLGDEALAWARLVKSAFDPRGIFNPGAKVALPGQRSIEQVKYDPALASLPPRAARALDFVAGKRAYEDFRLDLLDRTDKSPTPIIARSDPAD